MKKLSDSEQEQIIGLLNRIYQDICAMETQFRLLIGDGDFRPRIEYFHDAIRALTKNDAQAREKGGRLSVEFLSYDVSCLRYLQAMPLSPFKPHAANLSPATDIMKLDQHTLLPAASRPNRVEKERLSELYQRYGVLFAALLKPLADHDYNDRADELNQDVGSIHTITEQVKSGKANESKLMDAIQHINDPNLRLELLALLKKHKPKDKEELDIINQILKDIRKKKDKEITDIDSAHMGYAMAQLAIYEESKDMVKKLAQQGMNLVGKFVESSIKETQREMGR